MQRCWYVAYGSNLCGERFSCYLRGGRPPGGRRTYPGARDRRAPDDDRPCWIDGGTYFARESPTWTGGMAFLDPALPGAAPARAYLISTEQFADVVAQEMRRDDPVAMDLTGMVPASVRAMGAGHYETVVACPAIDGIPAYTFTAPGAMAAAPLSPPSAAYLALLVRGLQEAHGWSAEAAARHWVERPGAHGAWTVDAVLQAVRSPR